MSIKEIQERHEADIIWSDKYANGFLGLLHKDRGELLDALKYESAKCPWCGVKHERGMNTLCPFTKAEAALRETKKQIKRANDMINDSYQCECGDPKTPCPCLEDFLDNIQAILEQS